MMVNIFVHLLPAAEALAAASCSVEVPVTALVTRLERPGRNTLVGVDEASKLVMVGEEAAGRCDMMAECRMEGCKKLAVNAI